jgi:hypothetical protein
MPITVSRRKRQRFIVARATGALKLAELVAFVQTVRAPIEYRDWPLLFDASGATTTENAESVAVVVEHVKIAAGRERGVRNYAALVADDDALYSLFLTYETRLMLAGLPLVRVFRQRSDGERWLATMGTVWRFESRANR